MSNCTRSHVLVTGASSGIGRSTALHLAAAGQHVYAGVLPGEEGAAPPGLEQAGQITPVTLDITDHEQVSAAAKTIAEHVGRRGLDGLVNNAGLGLFGPLEIIPLDRFRHLMEVNVTGQVAVTQALLPLVRSARGRVIFIGSIGSRFTLPYVGPIAASKSAVATLASALRQEVAPWAVRVVLIQPASIHTPAVEMFERDADRLLTEADPERGSLYQGPFRSFVTVGSARERRGSPPEAVAKVIAHALSTPRPRTVYLAGKDSRRMALISALPESLLDVIRRKLTRQPPPASQTTAS